MANNVNLSPGTYITEKDLTFTVEALGVTTLGLTGETVKGPAFQPLFVKNYDVFKTLFGGTNPEKFRNTQIPKYELPYIAKSYLTQSNQLYVTRVLGLSGYNKGTAYVLKTIGAIDTSNIVYASGSTIDIPFTYDLTTANAVPYSVDASNSPIMTLSANIAALTGVNQSKFDTTFATYFNKLNYISKNWYKGDILKWGDLSSLELLDVVSASKLLTGNSTPLVIDAYELPISVTGADESDYFLLNELSYIPETDNYTGVSFTLFCENFTNIASNLVKGTLKLIIQPIHGIPLAGYHNKLVATLRSRAQYVSDALVFNVNTLAITDASQIASDPYGTFVISGTTPVGTFSHNLSLNLKKKNYVKNVLGVSMFDKNTNIYVEDVYDSILGKGVRENKIKGLFSDVVTEPTWSHFKFQFQAPVTPYFVSELRGGIAHNLFRAVSISDGSSANTEVKVSIANVDLGKKTFDVLVRSFYDSDKSPVVLERYLGCSMNESDNNYLGKKIGTIDNKYDLKSSYIIVDIDDQAASDSVPCGFQGYEFRTSETVGMPDIYYKTKYYSAGDIIVTPILGTPVISSGEKVKKAYLGFSDLEYGFDADLLAFKGKISLNGIDIYNTGNAYSLTKGFHMDKNADTTLFITGVGEFEDPTEVSLDTNNPYHDIKTRKFTALLSGGFDGWDDYRESRTNGDNYKIGKPQFMAAGFNVYTSAQYAELFGTSDYYAYWYGIKAYENPEATIINILATPGIDIENNTELVRDTIEMMEEKRKDSIYIPTLADIKLLNNNSSSNTDDWYYPNDIIGVLESADLDTNYAAVYYPWIQVVDTENSANIFLPPTGEVVRNLAYTDNVAQPWYASAGYKRGIVNTKKARLEIDQEDRDTLYVGRINPLPTFTDVGVVIFGNKNLQIKNSAMNRLSVRRLLLQAQKLIMNVANRLLFDPNDDQIRNQFLSQVNPILDSMRKERGLSDFRVILSAADATDVDRNTLQGKIYIKPISSLEFIELEFNVAPNNVSFDTI